MPYTPDASRYESTEYARVGRSGLKLPRISLGLWNNFGYDRPLTTQRDILHTAFDLGVTHIDIANNYGPPAGSAESNFGTIFAQDLAPYRDELVISSKAGFDMPDPEGVVGPYQDHGSRKYLLSSLDRSLKRTGLEYFDIFYHHRPDPETPVEETAGALASAVQQGKALYAGVSNYDPEQTRAIHAALADAGVPLLIHQPRYSMFDRHNEPLFPVLEELGVGSIVFSPLEQGLLTDRYIDGTIPAGSRASEGRWLQPGPISDVYLERVRALRDIAAGRGQTLAQLAISWVLRHTVTSALVGASSAAQLRDTVASLDAGPLTDDEIAAIEPLAVDGTRLR
ncbi:aldo/keto reductase [Galbitalea sp. SE-J8]|uniref:aldo/keto reductase n=1 Tax=Galbitalea sp. SE-J8 TaxID=3054952 RepID=UPI00259CEF78|nr:aldo/keto reductase [Galbitalea sp. SE-J8]MDM4764353.1 aldo/keto reductase [Galbitalea sp. SE-J8]